MTIYQAVISIKHHSFDVIAVFAAINLDSKLKHFLTAPISIQKDKIIKLLVSSKRKATLLFIERKYNLFVDHEKVMPES
jgi:hypothetical protein